MTTLALKNLFHDKVRLVVTLTGITFALVLIIIQVGLFLGFTETSANVVARSGVDLWIAAPGIPHVNGGSTIPERQRYKALSVPGVAAVEPYALFFVNWKLPSGAQEAVQVVGFDPVSRLGQPWNVTVGEIDDLRGDDTVFIDEHYARKLGVAGMGASAEMNGRRARVVGFTRGIRSFTTAPYVFTSFKNAMDYVPLQRDQTIFLVARLAPGADPLRVKREVQRAVPNFEVLTNDEMHARTRDYWLFSTGAGVTTLMGAVLGLIVGVVVVAQTIYAATVDHIREFGTLKAMGANNAYIYRVILEQALISALIGFGISITIAFFVVRASRGGDALILLTPEVAVGTLLVSVAMCMGASLLSIRKATTIDPAMVFKA